MKTKAAAPAVAVPAIVEEVGSSVLTIPLTDADRAALDEMAGAAGVSCVNVVRLALWHYGRHLGIDLPIQIFGVRRGGRVPPA